jgi:hypothetical protein
MGIDDMDPGVKAVLQEAEAILGPGTFSAEEIFFSTGRRTTRKRIRSARAILPILKFALEPGEKVGFISAGGYTYHPWEQFFGAGAWAAYVNSTTAVLTNRRLLAFNVTYRNRRPKDIKNAVPSNEIASVRQWMGALTFRLQDGRKLRIVGMALGDSRELSSRLNRELAAQATHEAGARALSQSLQHLCPSCCKPVDSIEALRCSFCPTEFRSGRTAALRSLLLPGLGDIYLKHTAAGVLELFGSVIVWFMVLGALSSGGTGGIILAAVLLGMVNGTDYFVTKAMAKKGIIAK